MNHWLILSHSRKRRERHRLIVIQVLGTQFKQARSGCAAPHAVQELACGFDADASEVEVLLQFVDLTDLGTFFSDIVVQVVQIRQHLTPGGKRHRLASQMGAAFFEDKLGMYSLNETEVRACASSILWVWVLEACTRCMRPI